MSIYFMIAIILHVMYAYKMVSIIHESISYPIVFFNSSNKYLVYKGFYFMVTHACRLCSQCRVHPSRIGLT